MQLYNNTKASLIINQFFQVKLKLNIRMEIFFKAILNKGLKMVKEFINLIMEIYMKDNLKMIKFQDKENIIGKLII